MNNKKEVNRTDRIKSIIDELGGNKNRADRLLDNFKTKIEYTDKLTDWSKNSSLSSMITDLNGLYNSFAKLQTNFEKSAKDYSSFSNILSKIDKTLNSINSSSSAKELAKDVGALLKALEKFGDKNIPGVDSKLTDFIKGNKEMVNIILDYFDVLKQESKTFKDNLRDAKNLAKDTVIQLSNAFNLQKLVTGGMSFKDLSAMQGNVKVSMNLDTAGFKQLQGELIEQNREVLRNANESYITFSDTVNYLSSIKDYSFKNYNQSIALYKQVIVGNKYLSLSNQSLSSMVKATNQLADESYINRQMAVLAALGSDSGLAEDMESLAQFSASNIAGLGARYNNGENVMYDALAIHSVNEAYLGNNAQLYNNLMSEIMNANDFAALSANTQQLLAISGMASEVQQMMRSGNLDMQQLMVGFSQGLSNFAGTEAGKTTLDYLGYGQWTTAADTFNSNRDQYLKSIDEQIKLIKDIDLSSEEGVNKALERLAKQNDNRTWWNKVTDNIMSALGIQNQNWTELLSVIQMAQTLLTTFTLVTSIGQWKEQVSIKGLVAGIAAKLGISEMKSWWGSDSKFNVPFTGGKTALTNGTMVKAAGAIGTGLFMGITDGLQSATEGKGFLRGAFLGNGSATKSGVENALEVGKNGVKYAAMGYGIGSIFGGPLIGGVIGGALGLILGAVGASMDENSQATRDNTAAIENSNDYMVSKSYLNKIFKQYALGTTDSTIGQGGDESPAPLTGGVAVGTPTSSYKYRITSNYGDRKYWDSSKKKWISDFHKGVDFGFPQGTPIGAAQSGTVVGGASGYNGGAGQFLRIRGVDGLDYLYYHLHKRYVNKGDKVTAGDLIALSGGNRSADGSNAGQSTGAHLHFQVNKDGGYNSYTRPYAYITSQLFNPGSAPTYSSMNQGNDISNTEVSNSNLTYRLSKESLFNVGASSPVGQGGAINDASTANYATSSDVDRLIDVIREVNEVKESQKELMQMLAGGNTFVYGRE